MRRMSAILVLTAAALPAAAESMPATTPMASYTLTASGTTRLAVAEGLRYDPATGTETPMVYSVANPTGGQSGMITNQASAGFTEGGISIATLGLGNGTYEAVPATPYDRFATVDFAVTDMASGESQSVTFQIGATGNADFNSQTFVDLSVVGPTEASFTLGASRYDLRFDIYRSESYTAFFADYSVTPVGAVVDSPEPATLALAALGLGGLLARRLRRAI